MREQQTSPSPPSGHSSVAFTPDTPPYRHVVGDFELQDLGLSHHWTVHTGRSISHCWSTESPCGVDIFRLGTDHLFVMYGILSVASLYLASHEPIDKKRYLETAEMHHKHGIEQVLQLGWDCMDDSGDALRAFSTLNLIYTLATFGPLATLKGDSSQDKLSNSPQWIRQVRAIAPNVDICQYPTPLDQMDGRMDFAAEDDYFVRIRETFRDSHASDVEVYDSALLLLRRCHSHLSGPRSYHGDITTPCDIDGWYALLHFLCHLSEEYIEKLHQRQPPALIIFSFFGAILSLQEETWFIKGWARSIVATVDTVLGSYWAQYTEWCRDIVALRCIEAE
ncbi:UPC2-regulatory involved in control of sterol uptake [Fusarium acutatum]|uniref:UPC2-regulatory involved in control of sterol uptake n=1 Tax=Fusarium acutatum TaxID=78861 RepID=A0A8H4NPY9_9HYPO|nr:UPC2-regulatory involved in control of sterol uptake [Fusarium acutatum]